MADDSIAIVDNAPVDTLKFLNTELGQDTTPIVQDDETDDNKEKDEKLELKDTGEDDLQVKDDDIDFRPALTKKELIGAYPDIFKKFPQLERSIYRERQFSELFPSLADAKAIIERAQTLEKSEELLFRGDIHDILDSVRSEDKEAFLRIVDNILPTLDKIDRGTYLQFIGNIGKGFIKNLAAESQRFGAESEQGKTLTLAATVLHQFLFGNSEWKEPAPLAKVVSEDDKKTNSREQEILQQRFLEAHSDLNERATNAVKSSILQYIDPKESMTEYVKAKAVDDCGAELTSQINQDKQFLMKLDNLWKQAADSNFSKASLEKIKSTYFAKAQVLLPTIIKSVRAKALSGMGKNTPARKVSEVENNERVGKSENGRSNTNKSGRNDSQPGRRESTRDYLNRTLGD